MWNDQVWDIVDDAVRRLEESRRSRAKVDLRQFVPPPDDPRHGDVLATLIKVDQEHRWKSGEHRLLEEYIGDWPELKDDSEVVVDLLDAECRTRAVLDALPTVDELRARFPIVYDRIDLDAISAEAKGDRTCSCVLTMPVAPLESTTLENPAKRADQPSLPPGSRLGRYYVVAVLGRGGMGTVYLAKDKELERTVAIKVLHRGVFGLGDEANLLLDEARTVAKLKHPSIVAVYDVGKQEDGTCFFVMEYIEGDSLAGLIKSGRIEHHLAVALSIQVADALHSAHKQGFVHRDIKPANILIDSDGKARVTDFGLAVHEKVQQFRAGECSGTLSHMAPEQVRGEAHLLDGRVDIWALGAVLYEMLTDRRPFTADSFDALSEEILHREPKPPRQIDDKIPAELERVCLKCLSKSVTERYATCRRPGQ